jgi:hypothetical protein
MSALRPIQTFASFRSRPIFGPEIKAVLIKTVDMLIGLVEA